MPIYIYIYIYLNEYGGKTIPYKYGFYLKVKFSKKI